MKKLLCIVNFFLITQLISLVTFGQGTVETRSFVSPALGVTKYYKIYLPPDYYQSTENYPVVYFFRNHQNEWFNTSALKEVADDLIESGLIGKMILIGPNTGSDDGSYVGCINMLRPDLAPSGGIGTGMFEDYIVNDLITHIDTTFRTIADKGHRGIDGFSLGGFISTTISLRNPDLFSSVGSFDGTIMFENLEDPGIPGSGPDDDLWMNLALIDPIFNNPRDVLYMLLHSASDILENADPITLGQFRENRYHISTSYKEGTGNCFRNQLLVQKFYEKGIRNSWGDPIIFYNGSHDYEIANLHATASLIKHWQTFNSTKISAPSLIDFSVTNHSGASHTVTIFNYGPEDLVVNDVYTTTQEFTIVNLPSLPVTLQPLTDSLTFEILFMPTLNESYVDTAYIQSNDQVMPLSRTILRGKGGSYFAKPGFLYASSYNSLYRSQLDSIDIQQAGSYGAGNLYIKELSVHPFTHELFGLSKSTGDYYDIYRLNTEGGDAFLYYYFLCPSNILAAAFGPDSLLYLGGSDGKIYTADIHYDLFPLSVNLIAEVGLPFTGFAFNYSNGELWAAVNSNGNNDNIYKINITTGDTFFIGNTGINKTIDDLCFDVSGNLYGLVGSAGETDSLIVIDTLTATATSMSSLNTNYLYAIAISNENPSSIIAQQFSSIPDEFRLSQNYPNPFNPLTNIQYSIPEQSKVVIKVFDILGNELEVLVNEEKPAGNYVLSLEATDLPSGVYFYQLRTEGFVETKKMVLLK